MKGNQKDPLHFGGSNNQTLIPSCPNLLPVVSTRRWKTVLGRVPGRRLTRRERRDAPSSQGGICWPLPWKPRSANGREIGFPVASSHKGGASSPLGFPTEANQKMGGGGSILTLHSAVLRGRRKTTSLLRKLTAEHGFTG